jgi:hypothetical protein
MRKTLLFLMGIFSFVFLQAQTVVFSETFEGSTLQVTSSTTNTGTPPNAWALSSNLHYQGAKSDSCVVTSGDTTWLTTNSFSTTGNSFVMLEFAQICKIDFGDKAIVEVSGDNGATWTKLVASQYLGSGQFANNGNAFNEVSYVTDWSAGSNVTPTNTWWKNEAFDISSIAANKTAAKIRFTLYDAGVAGSNGRYGWLLDSIVVKAALSELQPPVITYVQPLLIDSVYNYGPFVIQANITDASGVDTALLIYSRNGGVEDTVGMTQAGTLFQGIIDTVPAFSLHDTVCYRIYAIDASASGNFTSSPTVGCNQFVIYNSPPPPGCTSPITTFPMIQDFESGTAGSGTPSSPGSLPTGWTRTPNSGSSVYMHLVRTGATGSSNTGPSGDHTSGNGKYVYGEGSYGSSGSIAYTQSPCFDITGLSAPQMEFWYHMYGATVATFTVQAWYGGQWVDIWSKAGSQGNVWKKAIINLMPYKSVTQFRFKTVKGSSYTSDIAFDDVKIWVPPANDAGVIELQKPTTPAISGVLPVKIGVKNFGSANLTSVNIDWQVNGVSQTQYSWTGTLPPMAAMDSIQIGTYNFTAGAPTLKFWTSSPNGQSDGFTYNDTLETSIVVCDGYLHGTYTVGTPSSDFANIGDVVQALNNCGIDSAVVFNVAASTYTGQLVFGNINGASATNTITFKGQGASTIIQATPPNQANQDIVRFNGAKHVTLDSLTFKTIGSPTYATGIRIMNNSDSNTVRNCSISVPSVTSSSFNGIIFSNSVTSYSTQCNSGHWLLENNTVYGGYYGISLRGTSAYPKNNKVIGNDVSGYYYYGLYSYYQDSIEIIGNYIHDNIYAYGYGIYTYYNRNGTRIEKNKIKLSTQSSEYGMYLYYLNYGASSADTCIVANNMISLTNASSTIYGIYMYQATRVKVVYNTINITAGSTSSRGLYQSSGSGIVLKNNIVVNTGGGYTLAVYTPNAIIESDYNDLYGTGTYLAYWGSNRTDLAALKTASGKDAHSVSVNPQFVSATDLHAGAVQIHAAADSIPDVSDDFDGDPRASIPCMGADEFILVADDAGIASLVSPVVTCPGDTANVIVELKNYGTDTLFTTTIAWKVDGTAQTSYSYSDTLLPGQTDNVMLGTYIFTAGVGHDMEFYTGMPNGVVDLQPGNDSLFITGFKTAIPAGTYTVGGTGADYTNLIAVTDDLNAFGVCGPVVFKVNTGTYTDRLVVSSVNGASSVNTITFTSATNDSSDVTINYVGTSSQPAIVSLNNASYITIKNMTFNVTGSAGRAAALWGSSNHNTIKSCVFNMPSSTSSSYVGFYFNSANVEYNTFSNNKVTNCYYGAYARGGSQTSLGKGNAFDNNTFEGFYYYGIYAYYQDSIMIRNNIMIDGTTASYPRGIYSYYCDGAKQITGNIINLTPSSYGYGMYVYYSDASSSAKAIIANNMISISTGSATSTNYGIYCYNSSHQQFYYNSINITSGGTNSRGIYISSGNNIDLVNNIFSVPNALTIYVNTTSAVVSSDYNNLYSNATNFAYWGGYRANLTALKAASGKDAHSIDTDPNFYQNDNLHLITSPVDGKATPITAVTIDVEGDLRDTLTPDIGADEFTPPAQDVTVHSIEAPINGCGLTYVDVTTKVINSGSDTISGNLVLKYSVDSGATYHSETVTTSILPGDTLEYTFTTQANITTTYDRYFGIWVVSALPLDPIAFNDTVKTVIFNGMIPAIPTVTNATTTYASTATISASSSNLILWFDSVNAVTPLGIGTSYTTPALFATRDFYAVTQASNGCRSAYTPLTVTVTGIPAGDVGISAILVNEGCGMDSNEVITIEVYNQGTATVSTGLTATYKVDNNAWVTAETISTSIAAGATIQYSFTATANLYALVDTMFDITAAVTLTGDPYHGNDTLTRDSVEAYYTPQDPIVNSPVSIAYGTSTTLTTTSPDSLFWYNNLNDTVAIAQGGSYTTNVLYLTDTFYVQAEAGASGMATVGTGTLVNTTTTYPAPYGNWYWGAKNQFLIQASELYALGMTGGNIESLAFDVVTAQGTSLQGFTIKMGSTTASNITGFVSGLSTVYTTTSYTETVGWNTHVFQTPFAWDGVSNIVIETCFNNSSYTHNAIVRMTTTSFTSSVERHQDASGVCASTTISNSYSKRPNMQLGIVNTGCTSAKVPYIVNVGPPPAIDAGMYSFVSPIGSTPSAVPTPISVKIKNYGTNPLTSVNITYELNGTVKGTYAWTGSIVFGDTSAPITIYTDTFPGGIHNMRAWVSNANGNPTAGVNMNDTISQGLSACLNGTYTVGDTLSDFLTISDALTALDSAGICGHVVFNIKAGTYNTQMALQPVNGMDTANTVTFQSITGDSTDVIIEYAPAGATTNYVVIFYGGSYYTLRNLTIKATGSYGHTVVYYNNSSHNTIENCIIEAPTGTSSNLVPVYDFSTSTGDFNTVRNSHIKNGYYGIYLRGASTSNREHGFVIENNIIENFYYYGLYSYYTDSLIIKGNIIKDGNSTYNYPRALFMYYGSGPNEVVANKISLQPAYYGYGIYLYRWISTATDQGLIANNMVSIEGGSSTSYGIYSYYSNYNNIYHNSINMIGGSSNSRAFYLSYGGNTNIINNIFNADGPGYAYWINTTSAVTTSDYNDLYTTGNNYAYWSGAKANLAALKSASGKDAHSLEVDPMYFANDDLHSGSVDINNAGYYLSEVPKDIDGDVRNTTDPDIGADEFTPPPNDASIIALNYPIAPVTIGNNAVHVTMKNFGADTLKTATVAWEVNSVAQTSYSWTGNLLTGMQADSFSIGSYNFGAGATTLKIWPENPNSGVDGNHLNDTLQMTLIGCVGSLHGTFTIGGANADYPDFASALMAIQYCGIDSDVVFNVNTGTYNEQLHFLPIPGAGDTATVTFQSATADSTDVLLSFATTSSANYTIFLDGADYIAFKNMTIESQGSNSRTVVLAGGANHNTFESNVIKASTSSSSQSAVIYSSGSDDEFNTFRYNKIMNSYQGIYLRGPSSSNGASANLFEYNEITGFYYYGMYLYYQDSVKIHHNYIHSSGSNYLYAMYLYYCNKGFDVGYNTIELTPLYGAYGTRIYYSNATYAKHAHYYNNFISISTGSSSQYGVYCYNSSYVDLVYNNINITSGGTYTRALYMYYGSNNSLYNNSIVTTNGGYVLYHYGSSVANSDHNNFYSTGGSHFAYWGGNRANLAALQAASYKDSNSVSVDPGYYTATNLHVTNVVLHAQGVSYPGILDDYDGDLRAAVPCIGADEFTPQQWDAAVVAFNSPKGTYSAQGTSQTVYARIRNFGTDTITSMNVGYVYGSGTPVSQAWTGILLPGDTASVLFTTTFTTLIGTETLKAYTMLPLDGDSTNDTLAISYAGLPLISPTYCDGFDGQNIWATPGSEWQRGTPQGTSINTPHSAPNVWMTRLSGDYSSGVDEYLLSPFIDFSNVNTGSTLKFWRNNKFSSNDGFSVDYSNDGGNTWITLGYMSDPLGTNWYNGQTGGSHMFMNSSSGWIQSTYDLAQFNQVTTPIQFRMHLKTNSSGTDEGVAIDDFCIELPPIPNDVGVISIDAPIDSTQIGVSNNIVTITVKNFGTATQTSIPVSYKIGSSTAVNGTISITNGLAPDSTVQFTFTQQFQSPSSDYTLCAFTSLAGDIYTSNDQTCENIRATAAAIDAGVSMIVTPLDTAPLWIPNTVTVRIKNYGSTPMTTCDVQYYVNSPGSPIVETWSGAALAMGDSVDFTFTQKYNSPVGIYQVCAKTILANDADPTNDQTCKTVLADGFEEHLENGMKLWQNVPNPAHGITMVDYEIPSSGAIRFELVDVLGQSVMLIEKDQTAGRHQVSIDASKLSSGIYYYTLEFDGYRLTKKMIVNK